MILFNLGLRINLAISVLDKFWVISSKNLSQLGCACTLVFTRLCLLRTVAKYASSSGSALPVKSINPPFSIIDGILRRYISDELSIQFLPPGHPATLGGLNSICPNVR